jgi:hypothetical protein
MRSTELTLTFSECQDLCDQDYFSMLDIATEICTSISLVTRLTMPLSPNCHAALDKLRPYYRDISDVESWPGTTLIGESARLYEINYNMDVVGLLKSVSTSLFNWIQPDLPEDLCFYRPDGSVWLAIISHERDGFMSTTPQEIELIKSRLPALYAHMFL